MANKVRMCFDVSATGPDLRLLVILDGNEIWNGHPGAEIETVSHDFDDDTEQDHVLQFEMQGKLPEHTMVDDANVIIQDRCIHIARMSFDDIEIGHLLTEVSEYHHDHNGSTDLVTEQFYGVMGCNGRVEMRFSTPIYLWLLENM